MNNQTVKSYISTQLGTENDVEIHALEGGASNLTFRVKTGEQEIILRTSPPGTKAQGAHNMQREYEWLKALNSSYAKCPKPLFLCQDKHVFERDFYAMQPIDGLIIRKKLPPGLTPSQAPQLCQELIKTHHQLHQCETPALAAFDKGRGYINRQITGWITRYLKVKPQFNNKETDHAGSVMSWLQKNMPEDTRAYCPIHNDFKFDNVVFEAQSNDNDNDNDNDINNTVNIIGVLDWELATVGDPLMDLGCSLAYWIEANDSDHLKQFAMMPTYLPQMMTRDELVQHYCKISGAEIDEYTFYYVYGLFRLAVIVQQIFFRYENGQNPNPAFAYLGAVRDLMIQQALKQIHSQTN